METPLDVDAAPMYCPGCRGELEQAAGRHGIVWLCRPCGAGAATIPILRQVAPREFVTQLWRAALNDGVASPRTCPSCTQPFTTFSGSGAHVEPNLEVCTRCYWVWLDAASLDVFSQLRDLRRAPRILASVADEAASAEAKQALAWLAAESLLELLP